MKAVLTSLNFAAKGTNSLKSVALPKRVPAFSRNGGLTRLQYRNATTYNNVKVTRTPPEPVKADMFCYQCEQTRDGVGCQTIGVCGKTAETADLQDLLVHQIKGISWYLNKARQISGNDVAAQDHDMNVFTLKGLFSTLTNVNFDSQRFEEYLVKSNEYLKQAKELYERECLKAGKKPETIPVAYEDLNGKSLESLVRLGESVGISKRKTSLNADILSMEELITYGIKGMAAYAEHAELLGQEHRTVYETIHNAFAYMMEPNPTLENLIGIAMKIGETNLLVMELLEKANTGTYGNQVPTKVKISAVKGKCILVSGHDLKDLGELLKQTEGKGINVYTHGEMLPAHAYPALKKYPHLVGNWGGAWQLQKFDFATFPGPVLMTTNCLVEPRKSYSGRLFTRGVVGWPGVQHITNYDFKPLIDSALQSPGFTKDEPEKTIVVGFGKHTLLNVAGKVIDYVNQKKINHFFLIGGCDGSEGERNYYKELALAAPKDSVILTLGCGKYRFNKFEFGDIDGIPRLLDMGQCNDSYGAIQVAAALAKAFNTDVNHLPLSFAVSWFEQKAVAVLLTLLSLGIKNIHLGPNLPAFVTPNVLNFLVDKFELKPINQIVKVELEGMLGKK